VEAAAQYEAVCVRAPNSSMCPPSRERAGTVRLKLASRSIADFKFVAAEAVLKPAAESADTSVQAKAKAQLASNEYVAGLKWEKASASADKRAALTDMESVAVSGAPVAAKANEWLAKKRPALLLADATGACSPAPTAACPVPCNRLIALHAGTPEAAKATEYLAAYKAGEEVRLYPLLVQGEKLIEECQSLWKADRRLQDCHLRALAADPDNPLGALASCGGNYAGDDAQKRRAKLDETWRKLTDDVRNSDRVAVLETRMKKACDDGEYEKQTPKKPNAAHEDPQAASSTTREVTVRCPSGYQSFATMHTCWCEKGESEEPQWDAARVAAAPPQKGCKVVTGGDHSCVWSCP
jgi:hypothetical protein